MDGHQISDESIALSYKHAYQVAKQGQKLEQLGANLQQTNHLTQDESEFVRKTAQKIQEHAKAMIALMNVAELNKEHSTEAFVTAGQHHAEATKLHTEINKILVKSNLTI